MKGANDRFRLPSTPWVRTSRAKSVAVVPRVSIIATDFAREVRTHGVDGSLDLSLAPFLHLLDEEVQFCGNHIRLLDGMHAFRAGMESFIAPSLIGDHLLDQFFWLWR